MAFYLPHCSQVLVVETSLERTLQSASAKLGEEVVALRTSQGATMDDVSLLRWVVLSTSPRPRAAM